MRINWLTVGCKLGLIWLGLLASSTSSAILIDAPNGRDSMLACQHRAAGHLCGHAEPKDRWQGLPNIPISEPRALACSKEGACDQDLVTGKRVDPARYNLTYYRDYHAIPRP